MSLILFALAKHLDAAAFVKRCFGHAASHSVTQRLLGRICCICTVEMTNVGHYCLAFMGLLADKIFLSRSLFNKSIWRKWTGLQVMWSWLSLQHTHTPPPQISQLQQFALLLVFVLACGASSGGVTGEATTRARCVHLLPHWQVMRRMLAVAMVNKQRGEEEFF